MTGFSVRKACSNDLEAIAEISRLTWEGEDYLENAASDWIDDGSLRLGEFKGRVVGTYRIAPMPCGVLWLEALRVHAELRGRGFGRELAHSAFSSGMDMIGQGLGTSMEFSTYFNNHESIHISLSQGFRVVNRFILMSREGVKGSTGAVPADPSHDSVRDVSGHIPCGWKYPRTCPDGIQWALDSCDAWEYRGVTLIRKRGSDETTPVSGSFEDPVAFLEGAETVACEMGDSHSCIVLHESRRDIISAARKRGYTTWEPCDGYNVLVFSYVPDPQ